MIGQSPGPMTYPSAMTSVHQHLSHNSHDPQEVNVHGKAGVSAPTVGFASQKQCQAPLATMADQGGRVHGLAEHATAGPRAPENVKRPRIGQVARRAPQQLRRHVSTCPCARAGTACVQSRQVAQPAYFAAMAPFHVNCKKALRLLSQAHS